MRGFPRPGPRRGRLRGPCLPSRGARGGAGGADASRREAVNGFGWGPASPPVKFKTLRSEVEVTGVQTADERDAEAKKRAVDVDADDEPEAKRAK
jgi:hypothetical protein